MARMVAIPFRQAIEYPESDGQPVGESEIHVEEFLELLAILKDRYRDAADVYVGGNMFLYYVEGDPRSVVCPDVFVVFGVPKRPARRVYKLWEEGRAPSFVAELTSASTAREDLGRKKELYARLGVREYVLFDPLGEELSPRLQGFRLDGGRYRPIEQAADGSLPSVVTGLVLRADGRTLRLVDPETGESLLRDEEAREKARAAEESEARAAAAEAELVRLRQELERLKAGG